MTGATIFGCAGPVLGRDEAIFFRDAAPWGFILFSRNIETPEQVRRLTNDLRSAVGRDAPVFIDQEGGRVARMTAPLWREWPPARDQVRALEPEKAARCMYLRARIIAHELWASGLDGNCAPLADIAQHDTHEVLKNRCYGDDVATVVEIAREIARGCLDGGVLPVLKHIPGHGRANLDSHLALPHVDTSLDALQETDFAAFAALSDLPLGMTAHIVYDAIDPAACATQSKALIAIIRQKIGFGGLLMTDDISMQALTGGMADRCKVALAAGCDLILHCNGKSAEMVEVADAAGHLDGDARERAARALGFRNLPRTFDIDAAEEEYRVLSGAYA